jgi:GNAT superfamily N-acetyltransferase
MKLQFRETPLTEIKSRLGIRDMEREIRSRDLLAKFGITVPPIAADFLNGRIRSWECIHDSKVVGHCIGDSATGEILGLSVTRDYEGQGIGKKLLSLVVGWLRTTDAKRIWLAAPSDPAVRAHGFYRAVGWRPTGERNEYGDEIVEFPLDSAS